MERKYADRLIDPPSNFRIPPFPRVLNTNEEYWPGNPKRLSINKPSSSTMTCLLTFANAAFAFSLAISLSESD